MQTFLQYALDGVLGLSPSASATWIIIFQHRRHNRYAGP